MLEKLDFAIIVPFFLVKGYHQSKFSNFIYQ